MHVLIAPARFKGAIDHTTAMDKGCGDVARRGHRQRIACFGRGGKVVRSAETKRMITQLQGLTDLTTAENAMRKPAHWLTRLAEKTAANLVCKPPPRH
jgi:hypothetical protein